MIYKAEVHILFLIFAVISVTTQITNASGLSNCLQNEWYKNSLQKKTVKSFQQSNKVRFFNGEVETKIIPDSEFKPGDNYTIVLYKNKIILGKNIVGDDGKLGGKRSHHNLRSLVHAPDNFEPNIESGSIKIHTDGSINISGYNTEERNIVSARAIDEYIKDICKHCQTNLTGRRLKTLDAK